MIISWGYLLAGLFFAWLPSSILRGPNCRNFQCEQLNRRLADKNRRHRRWWKSPAVWIDPIRGYVAVIMLAKALLPVAHATGLAANLPLILKLTILSIGVTIQTRGSREKSQLVAPAGYLTGLLLAWLIPGVSIPCVILGASSAIAFRRWEAGFIVGSIATLTIGYFFMGGMKIELAWVAGIYMWPVVLAWFLNRKLVLPVRN